MPSPRRGCRRLVMCARLSAVGDPPARIDKDDTPTIPEWLLGTGRGHRGRSGDNVRTDATARRHQPTSRGRCAGQRVRRVRRLAAAERVLTSRPRVAPARRSSGVQHRERQSDQRADTSRGCIPLVSYGRRGVRLRRQKNPSTTTAAITTPTMSIETLLPCDRTRPPRWEASPGTANLHLLKDTSNQFQELSCWSAPHKSSVLTNADRGENVV